MKTQFHLALPCKNLETTKRFYSEILGASVGRESEKWADINFYNHQLTFTEIGPFKFDYKHYKLDDTVLPSFHFGVIIAIDEWGKLYKTFYKSDLDVTTEVTFMENKVGEHFSFFITDPNGYVIEFKSFKNKREVFER